MRLICILLISITLFSQNYLTRKDTVETITNDNTFFINRNDTIYQNSFTYLKSYLTAQGFGSNDGSKQLINDSLTQTNVVFGSEITVPDTIRLGDVTISDGFGFLNIENANLRFLGTDNSITGFSDAIGTGTLKGDSLNADRMRVSISDLSVINLGAGINFGYSGLSNIDYAVIQTGVSERINIKSEKVDIENGYLTFRNDDFQIDNTRQDTCYIYIDSLMEISSYNTTLYSQSLTTVSSSDSVRIAGKIELDGNVTVTGHIKTSSVTLAKLLFKDENPVAVSLDGDDTYTRFGGLNILTMIAVGNISVNSKAIVITEAGYYDVICSASISCDQNTAVVHAGVAKNNVVGPYADVEYSARVAGDVNDVTIPNTPLLAVGDSLYFMIKSDSQADSLRVKHLNFIVKKLN